ncbi:FIST N-terminal domain-containing protein [Aquincola sp. MAHUQ-54]|uniref:FIST N-terminal domain-containing protein n=1 Tax=Aquincola agrisoli TaxID=3119538 RepID=A0AAW9QG82_9BURK
MQEESASVGVGYARHADAKTVARSAARQAREQLGADRRPGWVLVFAGGQHDAAELHQGLQQELGALPVVGGCGAGVISGEAAGTSGYECGVMLFPDTLAPQAIVGVDGLDRDEAEAGRRLGAELRALELSPDTTLLLFYDSVHSAPPPVLHVGSRLLDGLYEGLGDCAPQVIGAGTLTDLGLSGSYVFDGRRACRHTAVAVVLPRALQGHVAVMHGCTPASDFLEITRLEGPRVLELDGRPALSVVEERLGIPRSELIARQPLPSLTLGEKHSDPYAPFNESQYVNRLVIAVDPADEALVLFEADFHAGSRVQLMSYEPWRMIESAQEQTRGLLAGLPPQAPAFGLYIDCAGRSMAFSGMEEDEAAPVRQQVGALCPFLGFYSGVEIAPFLGRARPLDWTGVLVVFTHRP